MIETTDTIQMPHGPDTTTPDTDQPSSESVFTCTSCLFWELRVAEGDLAAMVDAVRKFDDHETVAHPGGARYRISIEDAEQTA